MRLKTMSVEELKDEMLWRKVDSMVIGYQKEYEGQTNDEWKKRQDEVHELYITYYLEGVRRGLVEMPEELKNRS